MFPKNLFRDYIIETLFAVKISSICIFYDNIITFILAQYIYHKYYSFHFDAIFLINFLNAILLFKFSA